MVFSSAISASISSIFSSTFLLSYNNTYCEKGIHLVDISNYVNKIHNSGIYFIHCDPQKANLQSYAKKFTILDSRDEYKK